MIGAPWGGYYRTIVSTLAPAIETAAARSTRSFPNQFLSSRPCAVFCLQPHQGIAFGARRAFDPREIIRMRLVQPDRFRDQAPCKSHEGPLSHGIGAKTRFGDPGEVVQYSATVRPVLDAIRHSAMASHCRCTSNIDPIADLPIQSDRSSPLRQTFARLLTEISCSMIRAASLACC